jgi:transposase-like protein
MAVVTGGESLGCPRVECPDYGERRKENIRPYHRYGSGDWHLFRCLTCGRAFSERHWTPFFRMLIPEAKAFKILEWLGTGSSIRQTSRLASVDKNTVLRVLALATRHNRWFQAAMARDATIRPETAESVNRFLRERVRRRAGRDLRRPFLARV